MRPHLKHKRTGKWLKWQGTGQPIVRPWAPQKKKKKERKKRKNNPFSPQIFTGNNF
jgi:hypothetical protein